MAATCIYCKEKKKSADIQLLQFHVHGRNGNLTVCHDCTHRYNNRDVAHPGVWPLVRKLVDVVALAGQESFVR